MSREVAPVFAECVIFVNDGVFFGHDGLGRADEHHQSRLQLRRVENETIGEEGVHAERWIEPHDQVLT